MMTDLEFLIPLGLGGLVGWGLATAARHHRQREHGAGRSGPRSAAGVDGTPRGQLLQLGPALEEAYSLAAHPQDLDAMPAFQAGLELLRDRAFSPQDLLAYLVGGNQVFACLAVAAMLERGDCRGMERALLERMGGQSLYVRHYQLLYLARSEDPQVPVALLLQLDPSWNSPLGVDLLRRHLAGRLQPDTVAELHDRFAGLPPEHAAFVGQVLRTLDDTGARAVLALLPGRGGAADLSALRAWARVLGPDDLGPEPLPCPTQTACRAQLDRALEQDPPRAVLLVGEAGVGKSTVLDAALRRLLADGWSVFEAGSTQLLAGQSFVGQLENRVQELLRAVADRERVLWVIPDLPELVFAGRTMHTRASVLDLVLPHLLAGRLRVVAPLTPVACEQVLRTAPALRTAAVTLRLPPAGTEETLALGRAWLEARAGDGSPLCDPDLLAEIHQRTQQYLGDLTRPGSLLRFLQLLAERARDRGSARADLDDAIALLSRLTGLPTAILDDREHLDLAALGRAFRGRVLGQPEAVDCLLERIAMIKAGLCDPRRPLGVFLFTGPTGTGKTELCRALASYLFGSDARMLRLDMSEFQHPESIGRLLGDADEVHGRKALVHRIREQPFAVVLLDEIEKAHGMVFDLFLQVFDEGRLTDSRGVVADFRHALVVMTSNVGVRDLEGSGLGFGERGPDLQRALEQVFRREFLNRIDRIVVFRALERETMRQVLRKELDEVLLRRGLRHRQWAVEWDASAIDFLLEQGWSPTLGARPLRRAIERHLLAPLAQAIVTDTAPAGDQFLFVRGDGRRLQVEFVDPDAEPAAPAAPADAPTDGQPSLRSVARDGHGRAAEVQVVAQRLAVLRGTVDAADWRQLRADGFAAMGEPDFWTAPDRFPVLGRIEVMDRIQQAVHKAAQQGSALWGNAPGSRDSHPAAALRRLAQRVFLLELAVDCVQRAAPHDAWLAVQAVHDPRSDAAAADAFAAELAAMYQAWAEHRGMEWRLLEERRVGGQPFLWAISVSGFGAHAILADEAGLHVLQPERPTARTLHVRVTVAPQTDEPPADDRAGEREQARTALQAAAGRAPGVVRRYRRGPSPEVRDRRRGWRSGRWERVLGGEFDLME